MANNIATYKQKLCLFFKIINVLFILIGKVILPLVVAESLLVMLIDAPAIASLHRKRQTASSQEMCVRNECTGQHRV